jgi:integrase
MEELGRLADTLAEAETRGLPFEIDASAPKAKHNRKPENRRVIVSPFATGAIRLLIFTGCRLREILHLRWKDVDLERGLFTLHDSKTGRRDILLNAPALAVLDGLSQIKLGDYVIAGNNAGAPDERPRADLQRPWGQVVKHAGLDGVTLHTLRHTHASTGVGAGFGLPVIGALLGHRQASTTAKYAHVGDTVARRASDAIGARLAAAMGREAADGDGEVVPFKRPR